MKSRLAVSKALNLKPLVFGLDREESPFELIEDFPANNSLKLDKRSDNIRNAFLSPIDYAKHGAEYCIVPGICVSSYQPTDTILLVLKSGLRNIERIAVDIRYTSEIILANIILKEKYRNESPAQKQQYIPMMPDIGAMLAKADAALVVNDIPKTYDPAGAYVIDLVEEWNDMTGLPYIHGFWVGREEEITGIEAKALSDAKKTGIQMLGQISHAVAQKNKLPLDETARYLGSFSYDLGQQEEESLAEYMHYAYYHGVIGDVPEIRFFDVNLGNQSQN